MSAANIYLTFDGNCEDVFNFYKSVFGGEFLSVNRFKEVPPDQGMEIGKEDEEKIMHVTLPIGKDSVLMGSDTAGGYGGPIVQGNNFSISVNADSKEDADKFFTALSAGGAVKMPMADTFWGSYFGMLTDKFGINWMISFDHGQRE